MQTHVDRFGRITLAKSLRDALGLEAGSRLSVEQTGEAILLRPLRADEALAEREGLLVFVGEAAGDLSGVIEQERRKRAGWLSGREQL